MVTCCRCGAALRLPLSDLEEIRVYYRSKASFYFKSGWICVFPGAILASFSLALARELPEIGGDIVKAMAVGGAVVGFAAGRFIVGPVLWRLLSFFCFPNFRPVRIVQDVWRDTM